MKTMVRTTELAMTRKTSWQHLKVNQILMKYYVVVVNPMTKKFNITEWYEIQKSQLQKKDEIIVAYIGPIEAGADTAFLEEEDMIITGARRARRGSPRSRR